MHCMCRVQGGSQGGYRDSPVFPGYRGCRELQGCQAEPVRWYRLQRKARGLVPVELRLSLSL